MTHKERLAEIEQCLELRGNPTLDREELRYLITRVRVLTEALEFYDQIASKIEARATWPSYLPDAELAEKFNKAIQTTARKALADEGEE